MLDLALTPDQKQLVETVRDFCSREFAPRIAADDRAVRHDPEIFAKLASIGLPGICFPQRYGGHGLDYLALGLVCGELEYVDTVFRTVLSVHVGLVGGGCTRGPPKSRSSDGWRRWRAVRSWRATGSPNRTPAPTSHRCKHQPAGREMDTFSMGRRCGSPTPTPPTSCWSSRRQTPRPGTAECRPSCSIAPPAATLCARNRSS